MYFFQALNISIALIKFVSRTLICRNIFFFLLPFSSLSSFLSKSNTIQLYTYNENFFLSVLDKIVISAYYCACTYFLVKVNPFVDDKAQNKIPNEYITNNSLKRTHVHTQIKLRKVVSFQMYV